MNTLFKNNYGIKIRKYGTNIHKAVIIPGGIFQTNQKFFVTVHPKNTCKLEFVNYLLLPFLDQPQSDSVVFEMINFQIYNIMVTKWKHGIGPNDIITSNEEL